MSNSVKVAHRANAEPMYNHSYPHIYCFRKGPDGYCCMQCKKWRRSEWEPQSERNRHVVCILKISNYHIIVTIPTFCHDLLLVFVQSKIKVFDPVNRFIYQYGAAGAKLFYYEFDYGSSHCLLVCQVLWSLIRQRLI